MTARGPQDTLCYTDDRKIIPCPAARPRHLQYGSAPPPPPGGYNLWQPTAEQRFWEVVEKLATGLYLCVTGVLAVKNYISVKRILGINIQLNPWPQ